MRTVYRVGDDVAWVSQEDLDDGASPMAYVARLPTGRPLALEGSACLVWLAVSDGGTLEEIAATAAQMAGVEAADITDDVRTLIDSLLATGLVQAD